MDDTEELVAFVTARLGEDEATAHAATPGPWVPSGSGDCWFVASATHGLVTTGCNETPGDGMLFIERDERDASHVARHDPARVLREVEAKRRILATCKFACRFAAASAGAEREAWEKIAGGLRQCVLDLAGAWSDHPDCRAAWKPVVAPAMRSDPFPRSVNSHGGDASRAGDPSGATIHTAVLPDGVRPGPSSSGSGPQ